jgi:hypothetical protein
VGCQKEQKHFMCSKIFICVAFNGICLRQVISGFEATSIF